MPAATKHTLAGADNLDPAYVNYVTAILPKLLSGKNYSNQLGISVA